MKTFRLLYTYSKGFTALAVLCLVAACQPGKPYNYKSPQVVADPDKVSAQLAQAADQASQALQTLAAIEQTRSPEVTMEPADNVPLELRRAITLDWVGPVEDVAKIVANRASYQFATIGEQTSNQMVVTIDVENKPIIDVLRSIGLQLGNRADIVVDAATQTVELRYNSQFEQDNVPF
ncbi:MAG: hypothetical protein CL565_01230 [Alphaproteobacteria bacterium]|nr:hypothetical protein [Alphaproteobacteria bacterium]|tara:strand:+ start:241 stop:774 length:534 start_codon:yes stop_codon:yes gene_type:complete